MSDPLRTDPADPGPLSEADRAARIEELLLSGLDHYFGGHYEQAINIWTRVAFLERGHGRARAYIERARGALAERQRESEECLHKGVAAYQAGDLDTARQLLTRAIELGGTNETALVFLQRLGRLDAVNVTPLRESPDRSLRSGVGHAGERRATQRSWLKTVAASVAIVFVIAVGALRTASWLRESPIAARSADPAQPEVLPIVRDSELRVGNAKRLIAVGRPRDALRELDAVDVDDPIRPEADRIRAIAQRTLLAGVPTEPAEGEEQSR
jgi:tetratricopeptide (TPR) repeat protein